MPEPLILQVTEREIPVFETDLVEPLELGRQRINEPAAYQLVPAAEGHPARLVIAPHAESENISRRHVVLQPLPTRAVRIHNRSKVNITIATPSRGNIPSGGSADLAPPFTLAFSAREIRVMPLLDRVTASFRPVLEQKTGRPDRIAELSRRIHALPSLSADHTRELIGWLRVAMDVIQATTGSADYLGKAAEALIEIVGLDHGLVLLRQDEEWTVAAQAGSSPNNPDWRPSQRVMRHIREQGQVFWQDADSDPDQDSPSLIRSAIVVAAPVLDPEGTPIGALYGERTQSAADKQISGELAAVLVELVAGGVATGLARERQQRAAVDAHVRLEQFFGSQLADRLARDPGLLKPRETEVTLLFCDVRGFSRVSEKLGPGRSLQWMNDVLSDLSKCVLEEQGVLVDYVGDELFAMWGAPESQADQASRATRAALAMLDALTQINQRWEATLGTATHIGIGINTGPAQVGNTGSTFKFKYGALGNSVNLASRIQGLTKYLKCPLLVSQSTREKLGPSFVARRVCKTQVVNIDKPVDLFEIDYADSEQRSRFFTESESILDALEAGDYANAARKAGTLLLDHRGDGPLLLMLSRATTALVEDGAGFDPVWTPPGK